MAEQGASGTSRSKHLQPQPRGTDGSPWDPNVLQGGSCQHTHTQCCPLCPLYMFPERWQGKKSAPCLEKLTLQLCK